MEVREVIFARGHENIQATHRTTLEITRESELSRRGDCIIAVSADKALKDLSLEFKKCLLNEKAEITILIEADKVAEVVRAFGSSKLILTHPTDIVVRRSDYICARTLAIKADKAAFDLSRRLVEKLSNPQQKVKITLTVTV
ncbi:MAG: DUF371 domain-containing protein [Candidatus Bathyarchaeales archaeon]